MSEETGHRINPRADSPLNSETLQMSMQRVSGYANHGGSTSFIAFAASQGFQTQGFDHLIRHIVKQVELFQACAFGLPLPDVLPHRLLVQPHGGDVVSSIPEVLPCEVLLPAREIPCNGNGRPKLLLKGP